VPLCGSRNVRERRKHARRAAVRVASPADVFVAIGSRLWTRAAGRPVDTLALVAAGAASLIIVVNAVYLQSGVHPAPFFANPTPVPADNRAAPASSPTPGAADPTSTHSTVVRPAPQAAAPRRNDPIADLIGASVGSPTRVMAVQRALSEFGYGQIRPSGVLDAPTGAAIEKFESERKMPLTGRLSDRLLRELSAMTGRPIE